MEREVPYALTFDDILLLPQYSEITPTEVRSEEHTSELQLH